MIHEVQIHTLNTNRMAYSGTITSNFNVEGNVPMQVRVSVAMIYFLLSLSSL